MPAVRYAPLLLAALLLSTVGDEVAVLALLFRVAPGGAGMDVAVLLMALLLPGAAVAAFAGKLVDERDAARVLTVVAAMQAVVSAALAFATHPAAIYAGAALASMLWVVSGAAVFALIPVVARAMRLSTARANGLMEFATGGGAVVGPVLGGLMVAAGGSAAALLFDAATFALLAAVLRASRLRRPGTRGAEGAGWSLPAVLAGYRPVLATGVGWLLLPFWLIVALTAVTDVMFVFLTQTVLGVGPLGYGLLCACWAAAYMLGAVAVAGPAGAAPRGVALAGAGVMGLVLAALGLLLPHAEAAGAVVAGALYAVGGFGNAAYNVAVRTLVQRVVPAALHGRAAALYNTGSHAAQTGGFLGGGLIGAARVLAVHVAAGAAVVAVAGVSAAAGRRRG